MRNLKSISSLFAVLLAAACQTPSPPRPQAKAPEEAPQTKSPFTEEELRAQYYYDLGPDTIDVSKYPQGQQKNYVVFSKACSACHSLARGINSPRSSFIAWKFYIFTMRMRSKFSEGMEYTPEQGQAILDFLVYDSMVRKDIHRDEFEAQQRQLERRFRQVIEEQMRRLFHGMPKPHRSIRNQ